MVCIGVLIKEKEIIVDWILGMQACGLLFTFQQLKLYVVKFTQIQPTPFQGGLLGYSWWFRFKCKHLELSIRFAKGLKVYRA